jgi:hypothetical protein
MNLIDPGSPPSLRLAMGLQIPAKRPASVNLPQLQNNTSSFKPELANRKAPLAKRRKLSVQGPTEHRHDTFVFHHYGGYVTFFRSGPKEGQKAVQFKHFPQELLDNVIAHMDFETLKKAVTNDHNLIIPHNHLPQVFDAVTLRAFFVNNVIPTFSFEPGKEDAFNPHLVLRLKVELGCEECALTKTRHIYWSFGRRLCDGCFDHFRLKVSSQSLVM